MATPFLAINWRDGGTPQLRRYVSGSDSPVGVTFGSLETGTSTANMVHQRVVVFGGSSTFIAVINTGIYRSTNGGAAWGLVHADAILTGPSCTGPYVLYPGGVPTLVVLAWNTSTSWYLFTSTDGVTWNKSGAQTLFIGGPSVHGVTVWRGALYGFTHDAGFGAAQLIRWTTNSATVVSGGVDNPASTQPYPLCVFNDRLFTITGTIGGDRKLWEFTAGAWVLHATFAAGKGSFNIDNKWALFVDPVSDNMVAMVTNLSGNVWECYSWDAALSVTNRTAATGMALLGGAGDSRIGVLVDGSDPGAGSTTPDIYLYFAVDGNPGTPMTVFQWNGLASSITNVGSGGNVQHAIPFGVKTGGEAFWTSGQRTIERISASPVIGGVRYGFKIYSPNPSVDGVSVRWSVAGATQEYPSTPFATLSNPSVGTLSAGNTQIDGLDAADNGATTFFVTWLAESDGFSIGDFVKTVPEIFS